MDSKEVATPKDDFDEMPKGNWSCQICGTSSEKLDALRKERDRYKEALGKIARAEIPHRIMPFCADLALRGGAKG